MRSNLGGILHKHKEHKVGSLAISLRNYKLMQREYNK